MKPIPMPSIVPFKIPNPPIRSDRAAEVARWFGLFPAGKTSRRITIDDASLDSILPAPGQITLITGPSGAGKSSLLRRLARRHRGLSLDRMKLPNKPIVDLFDAIPVVDAMRQLSRVGLGEAWSYLRTPAELSAGQRWRLKLALAMHRMRNQPIGQPNAYASNLLIADEFAALLDRITAKIVARCLRRLIDSHPTCRAIVATSHDDLVSALSPDRIVRCDFVSIACDAEAAERETSLTGS